MCPIDALYARQSLDKKRQYLHRKISLSFVNMKLAELSTKRTLTRDLAERIPNRPAFARMMEDIRAGKIKRVIVYKLDRISRSILDFSNMMEIFQQYHVEFVSSTEKFDTSTPIGNAMLNISIVFAQFGA